MHWKSELESTLQQVYIVYLTIAHCIVQNILCQHRYTF